MEAKKGAPWVRIGVDALPAVLFLATLLITHEFPKATIVLIIASAAALAVNLIVERKIAPIPAVSGGLALVFGAASLLLHRNDILQMKMTIVDGVLGAALFIGLALGKNPLKMMFGTTFSLPDAAWKTLAVRYGAFWWLCAIANEIIRRTQTAEVWAVFRVVAIVAAVGFALAQTPFILRHVSKPEDAATPEPPDPGF